MKKIIIVAIIVFVSGVLVLFLRSKSQSTVTTTTSAESDKMLVKQISISEVSSHSTPEDCWIAIEGSVYDVTKFIPEHPGEDKILLGCGKDATEMFNNRPGGGGAHSNRARQLLSSFQIGVLVN